MTGLGDLLRATKEETGIGLGELTVLSPQNDPFRLDTEANHINGKWFLEQMQATGLMDRANPIHNRGVHYAIVSRKGAKLPSGKPYKNDADCWAFLENQASKAARWLGYVPFEKIIDARNAAPVIKIAKQLAPDWGISISSLFELPDADELEPQVWASGFNERQRYRLVFFGEKTSLGEVLNPLVERYGADLYLPSGEISDTLLHTMAKTGAADGREMVVMVFADCDPAGYQMAVSIGHKLRALREALYPSLTFQLRAPCLTVEQVKRFDLPSTPLKETEKRADGWREKHGVEQTEIDALATLRPELLTEIVEDACDPFFDRTLRSRLAKARDEWQDAAQEAFDEAVDDRLLETIRRQAEEALNDLREKLEELDQIGDLAREIEVPAPDLPEANPPEDAPPPLVSSDMDLIDAIQILRARKAYTNGGGS
jgi:hypothetical protein